MSKLNNSDFLEILDKSHDTMRELPGIVKISGSNVQPGDHGKLAVILSTMRVLAKKGLLSPDVDFDFYVKIAESIDDING